MSSSSSSQSFSFWQLLVKTITVLLLGMVLFLTIAFTVIGVYQVWYAGRIFPGIHIADVNVGGLNQEQAAFYLSSNFKLTPDGKIHLWYGSNPIEVEPEQLGIRLEISASVQEAYNFGRKGAFGSWLVYRMNNSSSANNLTPTIVFDQPTAVRYLQQIGQLYDHPAIEAQLSLQGTQVVSQLGQNGQQLDIAASLDQIAAQVEQLNLEKVILTVTQTQPQIMDASPYANMAQKILDQPFSLVLAASPTEPATEWKILPEDLAPMLTFETQQEDGQTRMVPQLKEDYLDAYLSNLSSQVDIKTKNPRFIFNDETRQLDLLTPGVTGRQLDFASTAANVQSALAQGQTSAPVSIAIQQPQVSDSAQTADLGITELVHSESSYFYGSSSARVQNIQTAAAQFHGLLVPPNSTFSMAEVMDEITLDNGYAEALIIYNGQTIEGVGGGVCQVSTTLFRTAFFSGFPITERHPHAYRVSYYEKTAGNKRDNDLAGLDATVYVPIIDLKFENDTPYWLLMETYVDPSASRITWKFYSTWDGRTVNWQTTGPTDVEKPEKPLYRENPELSSGEIEQVEWEADGADIRVDRSVYLGDALMFQDSFDTHYEPWRAVYEYGPGTEGIPANSKDE
ncbi:VanW family protein [Pelolinea submarina]|uniref:Vancomycin resistance protein YoaR n=1 Tax=Pelolinea submarina TaxID=913107 RepID=A0A3E0A696_9CHLR|nr:VanW family protein [Pelolinea submarina]REG05545.1 vancomycin resistance protein YoaR [Pelolinea submarina]